MSHWYTKNLGDAQLAGESLEHIKASFSTEHEKTNRSAVMAIFYRHHSEGHLHCEVQVYFSPATATVAESVSALPCDKPSTTGLGLLVGGDDAWSALFRDQPISGNVPDKT